MSIFNLDDHYNQERYRYEDRKCFHMQTIKSGQRWNYPFLFHMITARSFWFIGQPGHRDNWFKEGICICQK